MSFGETESSMSLPSSGESRNHRFLGGEPNLPAMWGVQVSNAAVGSGGSSAREHAERRSPFCVRKAADWYVNMR